MKKLVSNPSYGQVGNKEAKVAEPLKPSPPERKINQEDAKRIGYQINLAFRAKDLSFDDINKVDSITCYTTQLYVVRLAQVLTED